MFKVVARIVTVLAIVVGCVGLDPTCFPGCTYTNQWTDCVPFRKSHGLGLRLQGTCMLCTAQLQQQPARFVQNSSEPTSLCLPDKDNVAVRGVKLGVLSVQKLLPPQKSSVNISTGILALVECGITDLEQGTVAAFPVLKSLQLDSNNLTHVKRAWFDGLKSPKLMWTLSFSHNNISIIDPTCFQNLTALTTLLLDNNALQSIDPSWFHNLKWLTQLSLRANSIKRLPPQAFKPLIRLRRLDLSRNALTCLSRETLNGLHKLEELGVSGSRLFALDDFAPSVVNWRLDYGYTRYTGQTFAVRVNQVLFCISKGPELQEYHVHIHHNSTLHLPQPDDNHIGQCRTLKGRLTAINQTKYDLPFVAMWVNTESDRRISNITHMCTRAWKDAGGVKVALGGDTTLQIVPMGIDRSHQPQTVAVVVSGIMEDDKHRSMSSDDGHGKNISTFGHEEMLNVTCHVDTVRGETHRHVFTTPLSSTPDGTQCTEKVIPVTRKATTIMTTEVPLNQTSPVTNLPVTARPVKEKSTCTCNVWLIYSITLSAVVGVEHIALLVAFVYIMIKRRRCSQSGDPPAPAVASVSRWMLGGAGGRVVSGSAADSATQTAAGDEPQYSEIPDDFYNPCYNYDNARPRVQPPYSEIPDEYYTQYYNTRPWVDHPYWEIPDEYYNNENRRRLSYPLTLRVPGQGDDAVPFYAAVAEVALPPSTRLGGKHPSYSTVPRTRSVPQIHARQRKAHIRSYGAPVAGRYSVRDMAAIGRYGRTRGALMSKACLYNNPSANRTIH
ncbi:uncharacterized protein LOC118418911 [Branchiostoma floridae]|uniref:Uncharacterized protein LOC118418911 n=1 Tax=Branchiostoma floridae TaxID=7739 RepID=A0A9J7LEY5_BRAFL|nr:uncharacterized protein LOC118418911 [Branchiostoma floridae]